MQRKTKQLFFNFMVLFFTICLLIIVAEIAARIISREPDENRWVGAEKKYYEYDPLLGWKKIPNTNTLRISIRGKNKVLYQINSKSIRGPEYPYDKPHDEYRILVLGDSFSDGYMIEFNNLFSEVLKSRLNSNIKKRNSYQVINTGTSGWSTDQELLLFQHEGKKYNPDLTILMFCENDITYNNLPKDWSMYYKPLFKIKNRQLVLTNVPVPKPDKIIYSDYLEPKDKSVFKQMRKWLHENSHLYSLIKNRIGNTYLLKRFAVNLGLLGKPDVQIGNVNNNNAERNDWLLPMEYRVWEKKPADTVVDAWKITEAMLVKLKEETEAAGSELLVFYIPFEASIYRDEWNKIKKKYGLSEEKWNIEKAGLDLEEICKKNSIDFINPAEFLRGKAVEFENHEKRLYDPIDHHWTPEGNKIVGDILADYISIKYLKNN